MLAMVGLLCMSGCSSSSTESIDGAKGPSSGEDRGVGSLSEGEGSVSIEGKKWTSIEMDLEKYLRGTNDRKKSYEIEMNFEGNTVLVEADCYNISARYKLKDAELSFSRVSSPTTVDRATCSGFKDADNAVLAFLSSDYTISPDSTQKVIILEATDLDTSVTLKR